MGSQFTLIPLDVWQETGEALEGFSEDARGIPPAIRHSFGRDVQLAVADVPRLVPVSGEVDPWTSSPPTFPRVHVTKAWEGVDYACKRVKDLRDDVRDCDFLTKAAVGCLYRGLRRLRTALNEMLREVLSPKPWREWKGGPDTPPGESPVGRGVQPRREKFREWYNAIGFSTFHSYKAIANQWRNTTLAERVAICPDSPGFVMAATVDKDLQRLSNPEKYAKKSGKVAEKKPRKTAAKKQRK